MRLIADLHLHSHYSRATSKDLDLEHLSLWAQRKGVQVIATGDISHPGWLSELKAKLEPAEEGLFRLRADLARAVQAQLPAACQGTVRFMLAGEISNIYKRGDRVRKVHNVVFAPSLAVVEKLQARLERIGNIRSDGRPILGLDSRDLLDILLNLDPQAYLIPAHIWTPWFSMLGSMSGFDSVEECFGDLTAHIFALETGLSSDPPMNWRVANLDRYTLVSNSDAHSPPKLAREATVFDTELSYPALFDALKTGDPARFGGTLEFFPEEGKYHYDGHRKCEVRWEPDTTRAHRGVCQVCGKTVTVGVMHRVEELADRPAGGRPARVHPYQSLIPLPEILAEVYRVGAGSRQVEQAYATLLAKLGPELVILRDTPLEEVSQIGGGLLAEGVRRARTGQLTIAAGYDGEYGTIQLFGEGEREVFSSQLGLFGEKPARSKAARPKPAPVSAQPPAGQADLFAPPPAPSLAVREEAPPLPLQAPEGSAPSPAQPPTTLLAGLNEQQREAVLCDDPALVIVAGPGTGKTRTLTHRIAYLVQSRGVAPENILAVTFTNKAAEEMAGRLVRLVGAETARRVTVKTFHALGAWLLRQEGACLGLPAQFAVYTDDDRRRLLQRLAPDLSERQIGVALDAISAAKNRLLDPDAPDLADLPDAPPDVRTLYRRYEAALRASQALDFDDLVFQAVRLLETSPEVLAQVQARFRWISVDEYQDINLAQYRLLRLLAGAEANLCAIGDPDQAIYGFRGADRGYFLRFQRDFPASRQLSLDQNYRSTQLLLAACGQVITRADGAARRLWSDQIDPTRISLYAAPSDKAEAEYVVHQIEQMMGGTSLFSFDSGRVADDGPPVRSFADFAVLYRLGAQSGALVEAFERSGIPYQTVGQTPLHAQPAVKPILAHLWFVHTPHSAIHLAQALAAHGIELAPAAWEALENPTPNPSPARRGGPGGKGSPPPLVREGDGGRGHPTPYPCPALRGGPRLRGVGAAQTPPPRAGEGDGGSGHPIPSLWDALQGFQTLPGLSAAQKRRLRDLVPFLAELRQAVGVEPVAALVERVHQALHADGLDDKAAESVQRLVSQARLFDHDLQAFLESLTLQRETETYDPRADRVMLMTLHAAKGLEFPVVFIVGCEEGLLPYQRPGEPCDVEEERRLLYVGMTRAQRRLSLSHARRRLLFGQRLTPAPSRFLADIETALTEVKKKGARPALEDEDAAVQLKLL